MPEMKTVQTELPAGLLLADVDADGNVWWATVPDTPEDRSLSAEQFAYRFLFPALVRIRQMRADRLNQP